MQAPFDEGKSTWWLMVWESGVVGRVDLTPDFVVDVGDPDVFSQEMWIAAWTVWSMWCLKAKAFLLCSRKATRNRVLSSCVLYVVVGPFFTLGFDSCTRVTCTLF